MNDRSKRKVLVSNLSPGGEANTWTLKAEKTQSPPFYIGVVGGGGGGEAVVTNDWRIIAQCNA